MKKALHLLFFLIFVYHANSQKVVVNSPASLYGIYQFGNTQQGTASQWGADLLSNVWTGDAVVIQTNNAMTPTNGCDTIVNKAALAGKIVIIDRGVCNFSFKALNAQNYGAIAVVIINNTPGAGVAGMAGGTYGGSVTIPVVMLSYEDGLKIKAALANESVNISIGNIRFSNDLSTNSRPGISHASFGTYPFSWIKKTGDFQLNPGSTVKNVGNNLISNAKVNAKISFTPTGSSTNEFYNKTSADGIFVEVDSAYDIILDSQDLLGHANSTGKGIISYVISSDSLEQISIGDNSATSEFYLSNNILSKSRLAADGRNPFITNNYRRGDGTNAEYMTGFKIPYGKGCKIDSILFSMASVSPATLAGLTPEATLYGWQDLNADGDASNDEISFLALGTYTFDAGETRTSAIARVPLEDFNTSEAGYTILDDNINVFVGIRYSGTDQVPFFGFDEGMDYTWNNGLLSAAGQLAITDIPYLGISAYDSNTGVPDVDNAFSFTNFEGALAASLVFSGNCFVVSSKNLEDIDGLITISPNPAQEFLQAQIKLQETTSKLKYKIFNNFGKVVYIGENKTSSDQYLERVNLNNLVSGLYYFQVITDKGQKSISFEVMK
ncbi:MAG TPA: T9SS type A sorting domain-containing protein [Saprospiraceae bacterium]|nr:T9SS type A sorting domain-containing protein [Saprospiraceae bacterium]